MITYTESVDTPLRGNSADGLPLLLLLVLLLLLLLLIMMMMTATVNCGDVLSSTLHRLRYVRHS